MAKEWMATLPPEIQNDPSIQNFEDVASVTKAFIETKSKLGQVSASRLVMPGKDAKPEEVDAFYTQLGRPEKPEGYEIAPGTIPNEMLSSAEMQAELDDMRKFAYANGVTKTQFNKLVGYRVEKQIAAQKAAEAAGKQQSAAAENALRREFGAQYDHRVAGAQKIVDTYGGENAERLVAKFGKDPDFIALLGRMTADMSEDMIGKIGHSRAGDNTPEEAKAKIDAMLKDPKHPYHNGDPKAVDEYMRLQKQANPGAKMF